MVNEGSQYFLIPCSCDEENLSIAVLKNRNDAYYRLHLTALANSTEL
jgi:hypothetical protein